MRDLNKRFYINNVYRTKKNELVVFLGLQDGKLVETHGFFRNLNDSKTFFGLALNQITFIY